MVTITVPTTENRTFDVTLTHADGTAHNLDINDTSDSIKSLLYQLQPGMTVTIKRVGND
jgi:hypothetical protein